MKNYKKLKGILKKGEWNTLHTYKYCINMQFLIFNSLLHFQNTSKATAVNCVHGHADTKKPWLPHPDMKSLCKPVKEDHRGTCCARNG